MKGLQTLIAFAETAKRGSFAAAAREMGGAPSTMAKAVARLESSLGVKLFYRTTRQVSLTPDGERLYQRCQRVLAELEALQSDAAGVSAEPVGTLRIDVPIVYGKRIVLPLLAGLVRQYPMLELDVRLQDGYADLVRDGIDLAVRVGDLQDSTLIAHRIDRQVLMLVASPSYLRERSEPRSLDELPAHAALVFRQPRTGRPRPWTFRQDGEPVEISPPSRFLFNDGEAIVEAARMGLGLCQVPDIMVDSELASGELVEVLGAYRPNAAPISVVYPSGRMLPARVTLMVEALRGVQARHAKNV
ncbi:MAG: LysR family transcriptional regulator [Betaproteobacteria bacterium]